jgi:hypothetical protein
MNFYLLVEEVLKEDMTSGGVQSVYGPNVTSTATTFSGPNYAGNDSRTIASLYGGVLTRRGKLKKQRKNKKHKA